MSLVLNVAKHAEVALPDFLPQFLVDAEVFGETRNPCLRLQKQEVGAKRFEQVLHRVKPVNISQNTTTAVVVFNQVRVLANALTLRAILHNPDSQAKWVLVPFNTHFRHVLEAKNKSAPSPKMGHSDTLPRIFAISED